MKRGFSLIELVVVMAIIAILAALMAAAIISAREQAGNTKRINRLKDIEAALEIRSSKCNGKYMGSGSGCITLNTVPAGGGVSINDATKLVSDLDWALYKNGYLSVSSIGTSEDTYYDITALDLTANTYTIIAKDKAGNTIYTVSR